MALVKCPDCETMVSENADFCPKCGRKSTSFIDYCPYCDLLEHKKVLMNYNKEDNIFICPECKKTMGFSTPEQEAKWAEQRRQEELQKANQVHCPFCQSINVHKISGTERAASVIGLGIFSNKINKSFKCNNCKYTW